MECAFERILCPPITMHLPWGSLVEMRQGQRSHTTAWLITVSLLLNTLLNASYELVVEDSVQRIDHDSWNDSRSVTTGRADAAFPQRRNPIPLRVTWPDPRPIYTPRKYISKPSFGQQGS